MEHMRAASSSNSNSENGTEDGNNGNLLMAALLHVLSFILLGFRATNLSNPETGQDRQDFGEGGRQAQVSQFEFGSRSSRNVQPTTSGEIQLPEILITENQPIIEEIAVADGGNNSSNINGASITTITSSSNLRTLQRTGLRIVKLWIFPTAIGSASIFTSTPASLLQSTGNSIHVKLFLLKPCFISSLASVPLGAILFMLSSAPGNFRGKLPILKLMILLTSVSSLVQIGFLFAFAWQLVSLVQ